MPANGESSPRASESSNCGDLRETWLTITSAITSVSAGERPHIVPGAQPRIDLRVVDRIEAGIGAVDRMEEREHVHAAERALQRAAKQLAQILKVPPEMRSTYAISCASFLILHR